MKLVFTVDQIRAAEQVLLDAQKHPDQLMRSAAAVVAEAATVMLGSADPGRVLLLVGAGGNGGDALYAGVELLERGRHVDAVLLGRDGKVHRSAFKAFKSAGGEELKGLPDPASYHLAIDGILGIGGRGGVDADVSGWLESCRRSVQILAVDVPSGIDADTGRAPERVMVDVPAHDGASDERRTVATHVRATATVTFGGLRRAHVLNADCGEVVLADIGLEESQGLFAELVHTFGEDGPIVEAVKAWQKPSSFEWSDSGTLLKPASGVPEPLGTKPLFPRVEPDPEDDKYSGGVVGICAGSKTYPGAGVLATTAAVRATSAMVRYVGEGMDEIVRACPEVIATRSLIDAGRVQAWVVGPGRGTDDAARKELRELLSREEALLIDADAITLLAKNPDLLEELNGRDAHTLLTPHAGEFERLRQAMTTSSVPEVSEDPIAAVMSMARELNCYVLLKGRFTIISDGRRAHIVDAGTSWAATAGSGDVLAGVVGAWAAMSVARAEKFQREFPETEDWGTTLQFDIEDAAIVHAVATALSAQTADGPAPTSASRIAEAIPQATARCTANTI